MNNAIQKTIKNAWICQIKQNVIHPIFGNLQIEKGKIVDIIPVNINHFESLSSNFNEIDLNAGGRVITIPMVNFHDHFYSRLAKGLPVQLPTARFHDILKNLWWKLDHALDEEMIQACVQMGIIESIRHGVSYIFDHHSSPGSIKSSLSIIKSELEKYGLRGVLCFESSDRNGQQVAQQTLGVHEQFFKKDLSSDFKCMLGLHASFTLTDETLRQASQVIQKYNLGIHIHLCEDPIDRELSLKEYNCLPVKRLIHFKLLNSKSILSHGIHLTANDYSTIAKMGSAIAYNPDSNLNNAVGLPDFNKVPNDIPILAGTDGMHANIARSLKQLFLLYRHQGNSFEQTFNWIRKIYFDQLKFIRQYYPDYPELQIGDRGDMIIWDYVPPNFLTRENFWGHFIYGILEYPIHSVIQHGKFLMKNFQILHLNEDVIWNNIRKHGQRLYELFIKDDLSGLNEKPQKH